MCVVQPGPSPVQHAWPWHHLTKSAVRFLAHGFPHPTHLQPRDWPIQQRVTVNVDRQGAGMQQGSFCICQLGAAAPKPFDL